MAAYEYRRVTWDEVVALGPQGWRLVPVPPIVEVKSELNLLGQPQLGEPLYVVERETPVRMTAADMPVTAGQLKQAVQAAARHPRGGA